MKADFHGHDWLIFKLKQQRKIKIALAFPIL